MNKYEKIIANVKDQTSFLGMIKRGIKPHEIKEAIIQLLVPYFENKAMLERLAIDELVCESVLFVKVRRNRFFFNKFEKCIASYHSSKNENPKSCFEACALWFDEICESESKFWSVVHLEVDKCKLEIEESVHESLKNIGEIIEGLAKPYLKVLLAQNRIARHMKKPNEVIDTLELGRIVNELIEKSGYSELFILPPWKISLSQWRNIAYHHSVEIKNGKVVCWWGKKPNIKTIELSREEMIEVVSKIFKSFEVLKLAHTLFFVDNCESICALGIDSSKEPRKESGLLNFTVALASQGFEVVEFNRTLDEAKAVVKDVSYFDLNQRQAHASQFLFPLWQFTRSNRIILEYRRKDNKPKFLMNIDSKTCEKIYDGQLEPIAFANMIGVVDLETGKVIRKCGSSHP
jgi:hypothetical protein